jgi:nitric oxide reductase NorE protein
VLILGDMTIFVLFFSAFLQARGVEPDIFRASQAQLTPGIAFLNTIILLTSSWAVVMALQAVRRSQLRDAQRLLILALICGAGFIGLKGLEYAEKIAHGIGPTTNNFFMYYFVVTGLHLGHVVVGMTVLSFALRRAGRGVVYTPGNVRAFESGAAYWHMVDLLWVVIVPLFYLVR